MPCEFSAVRMAAQARSQQLKARCRHFTTYEGATFAKQAATAYKFGLPLIAGLP